MFMENETFQLEIGRDTKIVCREPSQIEVYIHSMLNLLYNSKSRTFIKSSENTNSGYYLQRNGFNA